MLLKDWFWKLITFQPHFIISNRDDDGNIEPQLIRRFLLPRNRFVNVYLHNIIKSDTGRNLHDHPWHSVSFLLKGNLWEEIPTNPHYPNGSRQVIKIKRYLPKSRKPADPHRLIVKESSAWTLFITGPRVRQWGFWCSEESGRPKWVHWKEYSNPDNKGEPLGCP